MNKQIDVNALKQICPLPHLMELVGLGQYAKSSCPSPFRQDQKASWGIFQYSGRWMYKDFGTGEVGDEIGLLATMNGLNPHDDFCKVLRIYQDIVNGRCFRTKAGSLITPCSEKTIPDAVGLGPGTEAQIQKLSALRGISVEGLQFAQQRGVLIFGVKWGLAVYGVRDQTGRLVEVRRLDGLNFPTWGRLVERKSHALKGSQKDWPLGIQEAKDFEHVALVEGLPDFLALHQYVVQEQAQERVGPVTMLSSACGIAPDALEYFKGKQVRIYPHSDEPGIKAAGKWQKQLKEAGVGKLDFYNFGAFNLKDLCEFNRLRMAGSALNERNILP
jgi:hypothetical protein